MMLALVVFQVLAMVVFMYNIKVDDIIGKAYVADKFNCYSLVVEMYRRHDIIIPNYNCLAYSNLAAKNVYEAIEEARRVWVEIDKPASPCVVLLKNDVEFCNHMGFVLDELTFIHCMKETGVVIGRLNDRYWNRKIKGYYKYQD